MYRGIWHSCLVSLLLVVLIVGSGCLNATPSIQSINLTIREKEVVPDSLGECTYRAVMEVTNTATAPIPSIALYIQVYDPSLQKEVVAITLPVKELKGGETRELVASLNTHCRDHYTLRAYVHY